ncbi:MAG: neutral/alkaline non-lysosomal ceramidase N-terminal domain-containing protein [Bacteroidales bacterium]
MNLRKAILILFTLILLPVLKAQKSKQVSNEDVLTAGIAKVNITPSLPVKLYGYSSRKTFSEGVHDSLYARIVFFENNGSRILFISSDVGSFSNQVFTVFREKILEKFRLRESELFLSAIHSHSAPVLTFDTTGGNNNNVIYTNWLMQQLLKGIGDASGNLQPVLTGVGAGSSPVGVNRREMKSDGSIVLGRNPYGPADKNVLVMKIAAENGTPVAAIYDYATHATSLGPRNMLISGDVLGISAQFVEMILGSGIVTPVFAGASGNIDPWFRVLPGFNNEPGWIPEPVLLGTLLGEEVVHIFRNIKELKPGGIVKTSFETVNCIARKSSDAKLSGQETKTTLPVNITAARVGDVAFIGFNVEMLTEIGMAIKSGSPFKHTFIITHCNGSSGYLPPAELYKEGGYEVTSTRFEIGSAETIIKIALRKLYDL